MNEYEIKGVLSNEYFNFDLKLINEYSLDFDNKGSLSDKGLIIDDLNFHFDFNEYDDLNEVYSLYNSDCRIISAFTLNNIGLTGVDTGYVQNTGDTITFSGDSKLQLKLVTGSTFNYPIKLSSDLNINKTVLDLGGGFLQGFFKLAGYQYQMFPSRSEEGFTVNLWMNFQKNPELSGITVDLLYPENKGYFFFMGTRAENKFYDGITGSTYFDETGSTLNDINGIGFYYRDNKLGYKVIKLRNDLTGRTIVTAVSEESPNIFTGSTITGWTNVTIIFKRNQKLESCCEDCCDEFSQEPKILAQCDDNVPDTQKGKLIFLVNSRPVFSTIIEEPILKELLTEKEKQEGVPYNISIGGGAIGLLEEYDFKPTENIFSNEFDYEFFSQVGGEQSVFDDEFDEEFFGEVRDRLFMERNFAGMFTGRISLTTMYNRPLTIPEVIRNFYALKDIYKKEENFGGPNILVNGNLIK